MTRSILDPTFYTGCVALVIIPLFGVEVAGITALALFFVLMTICMNLVGFLIGLAVMALNVYTATLARRAEYGVLKALGARNGHLLLSALTALENVALVGQLARLKNGEARQRAAALLTDLGLSERLHLLPEKLSGGEKQRVAIARALVNDPTLILADEPTANLDSKIGHEIMRLLRRIAKEQGRSVVIVSHDQRIKDIADRVLWLEDGEFKEMVTMATDPVCGMAVEREKAAATLKWAGTTYYFCSIGCRTEFESNQRESIEFNRLA